MSKEKRFECEYNWIIDNDKRKTKESLIVYDEECDTLDNLCELLNQLDQENKVLEKALELACKWLNDNQYFDSDCPRYSDCFNIENSKFWDCENCDCSKFATEYFKTKAKEMMKSEKMLVL